MQETEWGTCEFCGSEGGLGRTYFNYDVDCVCCNGKQHYEIVWHCSKCEAKDPGIRKIQLTNEFKHKL